MITQEQAKQILVLASSYAGVCEMNESKFTRDGYVSQELAERQVVAWEKLDEYVRGLVGEAISKA